MDGNGGARRKLEVAAIVTFLLVGIAVLGASGAVGLLFLAIALGIAIAMVRRVPKGEGDSPNAAGEDAA